MGTKLNVLFVLDSWAVYASTLHVLRYYQPEAISTERNSFNEKLTHGLFQR